MTPFRYHVFVCDQQKPEGLPCCSARAAGKVIETLRREVAARGLMNEVQITACGSLGLCERGPNLVVYPEGIWYSNVQPEDVPELVETQFVQGRPLERLVNHDVVALRAEITAQREKMLAAQRAREAAGALPDPMMATLRAFQESRIALTAIELDLFTAVGTGARADIVATKLHTNPRATEMLLNALVAMGWLEKRDGVFCNTPATARYFTEGSPDNARLAMMHTVGLWDRWSTMTEAVCAGTAVAHREMVDRGVDWTQAFIAAMHRNARERAPDVVRAVQPERVQRMLDVGGGSAAYSIAFAQANPKLKAVVFDLPTVTPIAQGHIAAAGLGDRVTTQNGDLRHDQFGKGYDLVFVSAICHMLSPKENVELLKKCHDALVAEGRVVIQDFILEPDKTAPKSAALFALNMLVGTEAGSSYSVVEYEAWLQQAGFTNIERVHLPGPAGLMIGGRR